MNKLVFTIIIFLHCIVSTAQTTSISGTINSHVLESISFTKLGVNGYLPKNIVFELPISKAKSFSGTLSITEKGMYRIGDGWVGHRVFITPGDTVQLIFKRIQQAKDETGSVVAMPRFHHMQVKTKYPGNYTYFDEIDGFFGQSVKAYVKDRFNARQFKETCDSSYTAALLRLKNYYKKQMVSDTFYRYAQAELDAQYVLWICTPLTYVEKNKLPANYLERVKDRQFTDYDFLIRTDSYVTAASVYNVYILNDFNPQRWYSNLAGEFHTASTYFKGVLRDRLMGWTITDYKDKNIAAFDSLYRYFLAECTTIRIKNEVNREVEAYRQSEKNKPSFDSILQTTVVTDLNNKILKLNSIATSKRWMLLDCWASWCVPCKKQLPFLKEFEKKYKDSIEFVYLSFDEEKESWQAFVAKNQYNRKGQYIVRGGFKSEFAKYFNLLTIPRYVLIDRLEKVVANKELPLPIHREVFEASLSEALNEVK